MKLILSKEPELERKVISVMYSTYIVPTLNMTFWAKSFKSISTSPHQQISEKDAAPVSATPGAADDNKPETEEKPNTPDKEKQQDTDEHQTEDQESVAEPEVIKQ